MERLRLHTSVALVLLSIGCTSPPVEAGDADTEGIDLPSPASSSTSGGPEASHESGDDGSSGGSPVSDSAGECAAVREEAQNEQTPADIIILVDNSSSMAFEAAAVQGNLNAFSAQIIDSGVDARIVLLSTYPDGAGYGVCIDPPLGSGGCDLEDDNPPAFTHVDTKVGSNDGLEVLVVEYENWRDPIRDDAALHIVMVSDDDSTKLTPEEFHDMFVALDPHLERYVFHGIVGLTDCDATENIGEAYVQLAEQTGGVVSDLCDQDFAPVFDTLATEVVSGAVLSCAWDIPTPPAGEVFDPDAVNVEFDDGSGTPQVIGRVPDLSACESVENGWYYDDPSSPAQILTCPQTCTWMQDAPSARIDVSFGCAVVPAQ